MFVLPPTYAWNSVATATEAIRTLSGVTLDSCEHPVNRVTTRASAISDVFFMFLMVCSLCLLHRLTINIQQVVRVLKWPTEYERSGEATYGS